MTREQLIELRYLLQKWYMEGNGDANTPDMIEEIDKQIAEKEATE